jgi:hypothetical protein
VRVRPGRQVRLARQEPQEQLVHQDRLARQELTVLQE